MNILKWRKGEKTFCIGTDGIAEQTGIKLELKDDIVILYPLTNTGTASITVPIQLLMAFIRQLKILKGAVSQKEVMYWMEFSRNAFIFSEIPEEITVDEIQSMASAAQKVFDPNEYVDAKDFYSMAYNVATRSYTK